MTAQRRAGAQVFLNAGGPVPLIVSQDPSVPDQDPTDPLPPLTDAHVLEVAGHLVRHGAGEACLRVTQLEALVSPGLRGFCLRSSAGFRADLVGARPVAFTVQRGPWRARLASTWTTPGKAFAVSLDFTYSRAAGRWFVTHWALL